MSALTIDETVGSRLTPTRPKWHHVPQTRGPLARPTHPGAPGGRPVTSSGPWVRTRPVVWQPAVQHGLQLTRRGLALAVGLFLGMVAAATITLVVGFFSVSNAPVTTPSAPGSSVVGG